MKTPRFTQPELDFIRESNAIEGVYDDDSFKQALYAWEYLKKKKKLTIGTILKTHKILMLNQHIMPDEKGYFRKCEVRIGGRYGEPWIKVPELMEKWVKYANVPQTAMAENVIKLDHVEYERIHPFVDGNGRSGRLFMNWQRHRCSLPILVVWEKDRYDYYKWFK